MKRAGFTMIELIFVIVIIGILAAVAVPKLSGVKDDAQLANANEQFCLNLKPRMLLYAAKNDGSLEGLVLNTLMDVPAGWTGGDVALAVGTNLNSEVNTTVISNSALVNTSSNVNVYYVDGNETENFSCWVGDRAYADNPTTTVADTVLKKSNYL